MMRILINISVLILIFSTLTLARGIKERDYSSIPTASFIDSTLVISQDNINIYPKDDNRDTTIPKRNRIWWYSELTKLATDKPTVINIVGDGWRGGKYVFPVYSYNNEIWYRFQDSEIVDKKGADAKWNFSLVKKFDYPNVNIARTYPYFPNRIETLINKYKKKANFRKEIIGRTQLDYPIYLFTITDFSVPEYKKKRIWIHARTHPGETQSSFVLEGLLDFILGKDNYIYKYVDLKNVIFNIIPIVNVDGIAAGNSRYTPEGQDLERQWLKQVEYPFELADSVAQEVKIICSTMTRLSKTPAEFILAINLHGKNALQGESPFLYTNFKKSLKEHGPEGDTVYRNQLMLAKCISDFNNGDTITVQMGYTATQPMQEKPFPESWWWTNFRAKVTAATIEVTESALKFKNERTSIEGYLEFGANLAKGLYKFYLLNEAQKADTLKLPAFSPEELEKFYSKNQWE